MKKQIYSVTEFGSIYSDKSMRASSDISLQQVIMPERDFMALCRYIEIELTDESIEDKLFRIYYKNHKKVVKAQNQVGVVQFANGLQIEILPKIVTHDDIDELGGLRHLLLRLLSHVKDYPYLISGEAQLLSKNDYPILEVFIGSYINEFNKVCLTGLKNDYEQRRGNLDVLKGKLMVSDNIRKNSCSQNKFFCQFHKYTPCNAVNRIIKATLEKLLTLSKSHQNRDKLYRLVDLFSGVESNNNIFADLAKTENTDRTYQDYQKIMMWSRLFLSNSSFTSSQGNIVNISIMFPMEKVFEDYITYLFKKYSCDYHVTAQDRSIFLVTHKSRGKFRLRPDIVVTDNNSPVLIIDTKWKLLNSYKGRDNYGISQSDMYQLYAYGKKYQFEHHRTPHLVLLYPENRNFKTKLENFVYEGDLELDVIPFVFDPTKEEMQISNILNIIKSRDMKEAMANVIQLYVSQDYSLEKESEHSQVPKRYELPDKDSHINITADNLFDVKDLPEQTRIEIFQKSLEQMFRLADYKGNKTFSKQRHWLAIYRIGVDFGFVIDFDYRYFSSFIEQMQLDDCPIPLKIGTLEKSNTGIYQESFENWNSNTLTDKERKQFDDIKVCTTSFKRILTGNILKKKPVNL